MKLVIFLLSILVTFNLYGQEIVPPNSRNVAPEGPRNVAPIGPRNVAPEGPRNVAPIGPRNVAPEGPRNVAPIGPRNVAPVKMNDIPLKVIDDINFKYSKIESIFRQANKVLNCTEVERFAHDHEVISNQGGSFIIIDGSNKFFINCIIEDN